MSDMKVRKVDVRLPPQMRADIEELAEVRFEGNLSFAIRKLLTVGLETLRSVDKPQKNEASTENGGNDARMDMATPGVHTG